MAQQNKTKLDSTKIFLIDFFLDNQLNKIRKTLQKWDTKKNKFLNDRTQKTKLKKKFNEENTKSQ